MVLIIAGSGDAVMDVMDKWAAEGADLVRANGHVCQLLRGAGRLRLRTRTELTETPPRFLAYFGHGSTESLCSGPGGCRTILHTGDCALLSGLVIYAAACNAAQGLGKAACASTCVGFLGFRDEILVPIAETPSVTDQGFMEAFTEPVSAFVVDNLRLGEVLDRTKSVFRTKADQLAQPDFAGAICLEMAVAALCLADGSDSQARFASQSSP